MKVLECTILLQTNCEPQTGNFKTIISDFKANQEGYWRISSYNNI